VSVAYLHSLFHSHNLTSVAQRSSIFSANLAARVLEHARSQQHFGDFLLKDVNSVTSTNTDGGKILCERQQWHTVTTALYCQHQLFIHWNPVKGFITKCEFFRSCSGLSNMDGDN